MDGNYFVSRFTSSNVCLFEFIFSLILFSMQVVDDSGRPKFQVQFKGETKSFFPEEVRFVQCFSQ